MNNILSKHPNKQTNKHRISGTEQRPDGRRFGNDHEHEPSIPRFDTPFRFWGRCSAIFVGQVSLPFVFPPTRTHIWQCRNKFFLLSLFVLSAPLLFRVLCAFLFVSCRAHKTTICCARVFVSIRSRLNIDRTPDAHRRADGGARAATRLVRTTDRILGIFVLCFTCWFFFFLTTLCLFGSGHLFHAAWYSALCWFFVRIFNVFLSRCSVRTKLQQRW